MQTPCQCWSPVWSQLPQSQQPKSKLSGRAFPNRQLPGHYPKRGDSLHCIFFFFWLLSKNPPGFYLQSTATSFAFKTEPVTCCKPEQIKCSLEIPCHKNKPVSKHSRLPCNGLIYNLTSYFCGFSKYHSSYKRMREPSPPPFHA